jgi:hypothetical protein
MVLVAESKVLFVWARAGPMMKHTTTKVKVKVEVIVKDFNVLPVPPPKSTLNVPMVMGLSFFAACFLLSFYV